jgi:hypothetical protein
VSKQQQPSLQSKSIVNQQTSEEAMKREESSKMVKALKLFAKNH